MKQFIVNYHILGKLGQIIRPNGYYAIYNKKGRKIKDNLKLNTRTKKYNVDKDDKLHIYYMQNMKKEFQE